MRPPTWVWESVVVGSILVVVVFVTGNSATEYLGAAAVTLSFCHAQVADRLAERDALRARPQVACHAWATRYLVTKEALWLLYFVVHHSWSALTGVCLFLLYPLWRTLYRRRYPLAAV